jgi:ATP-GRASP peptide maturase of grasp-with-spasm system
MILLLSYSGDVNMDYVITWLNKFNHAYLRINADEIFDKQIFISVHDNVLKINNQQININAIHSIWYRKFGRFVQSAYYKKIKDFMSGNDLQQISREYYTLLNTIVSMLKRKNWLTPPYTVSLNKMDVLFLAKECGLNIPKSYVLSDKKDIYCVQQQNKGITYISKSIYEPYFIHQTDGFFSMFTKEIGRIGKLPATFFPSLIQEKIEKEYELRIFYLDKQFYSMAIFSQSNTQTEMDFRKIDIKNPNRRVPYLLPKEEQDKLLSLLEYINLNCCSIDMIKSKNDGKYYFLEINPTGEFGMTSMPCNYELYKQIALTLIKMDVA